MDIRLLILSAAAMLATPALAAKPPDAAPEEPTRSLLLVLAWLGLAFVLVGQWLARRLMAVYRRKLVERMNSDADRGALQRALRPERLLAAIRQRRRVILAILVGVVLAYSLVAARIFFWNEDDVSRLHAVTSFLVTAFLFLSFSGPVILLGVSAARFASHFWTYFGPAAFAAVVMQTVVAMGNQNQDALDRDILASLLLVALLTLGAVALRQALPIAVRARLVAALARRRWMVRAAGLAAVVMAVVVVKQEWSWTVPLLDDVVIGYHTVGGTLVAAVAIWVCYAVMVDRVQRILVPLLALALGLLAVGGLVAYLLLGEVGKGSAWQALWRIPLSVACGIGLAWMAMGWVALAYERKLFSESQFQIWSWMLLVTGAVLATDGLLRSTANLQEGHFVTLPLATLAALALHGALARVLVRPLNTQRRLLVLRVFAKDERHQTVLEDLEYGWRFIGPIVLIGAPDFASRTIDPGKAARFLQKLQVADLFVDSVRDLERRLVTLDSTPDPDGRYRVNDLFCRNNTWQDAVRMLLASSEAILVDLREYTAARLGTTAELHMLAQHGALARTVLLVGRDTRLEDVAHALGLESVERLQRDVQVFDAERPGPDGLVDALVRRMPAEPLPGLRLQIGMPSAPALVETRRAA